MDPHRNLLDRALAHLGLQRTPSPRPAERTTRIRIEVDADQAEATLARLQAEVTRLEQALGGLVEGLTRARDCGSTRGYSERDLYARAEYALAHVDDIERIMAPRILPESEVATRLREKFKQAGLSEPAIEWIFHGRRR